MLKPLVSVVVTTYNHQEYITDCLDSILMQQTTFPYEIILGEDESTDGTREICIEYANKYPDKINLFLRSRKDVIYINGNPTGRYNFIESLNSCSGKYIALCEGDDYWTNPFKLQKQVDFLEGNCEYVMTYHDVSIINNEGALLKESKTPTIFKTDFSSLEIIKCEIFVCTMSLVYRNVINTFPNEFLKVKNADIFLTSLLGQYGNGKFIENIGGKYRVHDGGLWSSLDNKQKVESRKNTFFQLHKYYKSINNREISDFYLLKSKGTPSQGAKRSFKKFLKRSYKKMQRLLNG